MIELLAADEELRQREFPICARRIYCAHAADAPLPRRVADAMHESIERACVDARNYDNELERIAETRVLVARLLGCDTEEISFTGPTASGLNTIANGLEWRRGDEVVCYLDDYPANVYPWLALERLGVKPVVLETERIGEITPEIVERAITKRTRLVALASANYISGYRTDIDAIGALCAARGVLFSVDAIQTMGVFPVPLGNVDFASSGAQKWMLGPSGAGILFVKESKRDLLRPATIGGWNVVSPNFIAQREVEFESGGRKFEPGAYTHNVIAGLRAATELLLEAGPDKISRQIDSLNQSLRSQIAPAGFEFLSPAEEKHRCGILTLRHPQVPPERLWQTLTDERIVTSLRYDRADRGWLRVSPHFYNTAAEIENIAGLLNQEAVANNASAPSTIQPRKKFAFSIDPLRKKIQLSSARMLMLGLSFVSLLACAFGAVSHYRKSSVGNLAQPIGWLLSMLFLLLAFSRQPRELAASIKSAIKPKTAFFAFWVLVFVVSHLWHFRTAPWNGDGLFDESGWDLYFLKDYVMSRPYQAAWFHLSIARETLFHYYLWPFLWLFGFNILSYEVALLTIWCATFLFTLLLVDLFFRSNVVTSAAAVIFTFLPFAFIYTFVGYRYPLATALCVASLYFLHRGFRGASAVSLCMGGVLAGLCLASSISGKQYLLVLFAFALAYAVLHWRSVKEKATWTSVSLIFYGCLAAATPILCFIVFNREDYTRYEASFVHNFLQAVRGHPDPTDLTGYVSQLWNCFFGMGRYRFLLPDVLPVPVAYCFFLVPGFVIAMLRKRYEIVLLAVVPVLGAFIAYCYENRLLLAIPFWVILMAFSFDWLIRLRIWPPFKWGLWAASAMLVIAGVVPFLRYIDGKTKNPTSIRYFMQEEVAAARFFRRLVAGAQLVSPPRRERDELNRIKGLPQPSFQTFVCQADAYSSIHLFLHDYDKVLSFCDDLPMNIMDEPSIWRSNKKAVLSYVPNGKDMKLVWEKNPKTTRITKAFEQFRDLGSEETIGYTFAGREKRFYVLNVPSGNVAELQERVRALPGSVP